MIPRPPRATRRVFSPRNSRYIQELVYSIGGELSLAEGHIGDSAEAAGCTADQQTGSGSLDHWDSLAGHHRRDHRVAGFDFLRSLSHHGYHHPFGTLAIKFRVKHPLPCSQQQLAIRHRQDDLMMNQQRLQM